MLKLLCILLTLLSFTELSHADDEDEDAIRSCLRVWEISPFTATSKFRIVAAKVKVMGIGGDLNENKHTKVAELVLVRPAVSVMSKQVMNLENPNGWYCLAGKVAVLGKTEINLACTAHLAASGGGGAILGSDDENTGTTVLGSTEVIRADCPTKSE